MWFTSDFHFFHKNIIQYSGRPFKSVDEMNYKIIKNLNMYVTHEDDLYILGDLTFLSPSKWETLGKLIRQINGRKHLILGNHDLLKPWKYVEIGFMTVHTAVKIEEFWLVHDPALSEALPKSEKILCGHVHTLFKKQRNCLNVGVDVWNFEPVHIETIREIFQDGED